MKNFTVFLVSVMLIIGCSKDRSEARAIPDQLNLIGIYSSTLKARKPAMSNVPASTSMPLVKLCVVCFT